MSSSIRGRVSAAGKLASPSSTAAAATAAAGGDHAGPSTPLGLHPPTVLVEPASAAAAARISSAAKTAAGAAAAGLAAAKGGVRKLQQAAAAPAETASRAARVAAGEITAAAEGLWQGVAGGHMGDRLGSDIGLAGLADAAGHAMHELPSISLQRVGLVRLTAGLLLAATLGYAFFFAPNKLGMCHDLALLSRLFYDNALTFVLFNLLGLFPFILNCLMWPTLRSGGRQPAMWPHLALSYVAGAFALLSYLVRWSPAAVGRPRRLPLAKLTGDHTWLQRQHESRLMPAVVTASIAALLALCSAATPATWAHFGYLVSNSKAVDVMLLDLTLLTLMSPFLVVTDARARGVRLVQNPLGAALLGLAMLAVPLVAPGVYLLLRPITPGKGPGISIKRGLVPSSLSHFWHTGRVTPGVRSAAAAARDRAVSGGRQLGHSTAAAATAAGERVAAAGSNAAAAAAAAGSNAAATLAAARVPLPTEQQVDAAAEAAGFASGAVVGGMRQGWGRVKQGLSSFLGGGRPVAHAARAGSVDLDEVFMDHNGDDADAEVHTDSSDSTDHLHDTHPGSRSIEQLQQQAGRRTLAQNALGCFAYFIPSLTPGGGRELMFAEDYNETEADGVISDGDDSDDACVIGTEDDYEEDYGVIQGGDDGIIEDTEGEDDITFDVEGVEGGEEQEGEQGLRRGAPRVAKTVALQRLAEVAHFEHPRFA